MFVFADFFFRNVSLDFFLSLFFSFFSQSGSKRRKLFSLLGFVFAHLNFFVVLLSDEYTSMYPGMAKTAREEGFEEIAFWFETLARAEKSHAGNFTKTLAELKSGQ